MALVQLDSEAPAVAEYLRHASPAEVRKVVGRVCARAVAASGLDDDLVRQATVALSAGTTDVQLAASLTDLAARLDREYFDAREESNPLWLGLFHQARAASALSLGLIAEDADTAADCVYEAAHAVDDPAVVYAASISA
jgi:hypothetical protein